MNAGVQRLLWIGRNVADLDRAVAFYCDALGFRVEQSAEVAPLTWPSLQGIVKPPTRSARLSLGSQRIELSEFPDAIPYPPGATSADLCFQHCAVVVNDMDAAYARLLQHGGGTAISTEGPQRLPPTSGSVTAFKFRDADGHPLELISFPLGSGDRVWQQHAGGPTLGIDHIAISVSNVERSITFYRLLGFEISSRSVNRGAEQQRLDGLAQVEVDVIALQPGMAETPHLELLGYRIPYGRKFPNVGACAISADRVALKTRNLPVLLDKLGDENASHVTTSLIVSTKIPQIAWLSDPDGHWLVLIE